MRSVGYYIEGLGVERVIDKLAAAGVAVLGAEKPQKNAVVVWVDGKESKKVFAILQTSCYNIKKVSFRGWKKLSKICMRCAGMLAGIALFAVSVCFFQSRVLRIDVTGSGAYLEERVKGVLRENGVSVFSPAPRDTQKLTASLMALPRVSFCSVSHDGGVLTARVEVFEENVVLEKTPLLAPVSGTLERLTVVRGTALCAAGDEVTEGQTLVADYTLTESGQRATVVVAEAVIAYRVYANYALSEAEALAQAYLDYGEINDITIKTTETGILIEGTARRGAALNLG